MLLTGTYLIALVLCRHGLVYQLFFKISSLCFVEESRFEKTKEWVCVKRFSFLGELSLSARTTPVSDATGAVQSLKELILKVMFSGFVSNFSSATPLSVSRCLVCDPWLCILKHSSLFVQKTFKFICSIYFPLKLCLSGARGPCNPTSQILNTIKQHFLQYSYK